MLMKDDCSKSSLTAAALWASTKSWSSLILLFALLLIGGLLLAGIAWGLPIFLMWQGGWTAMLGLALWMFFFFLGKMIEKVL